MTHIFDKTLQKTTEWLKEIDSNLGWNDEHKVYLATKSVFQTLRDRLPVDEAVQLGAQLPMLMRGFYYEGYHPSGKPEKFNKKEEFYGRVQELCVNQPIDASKATKAVFDILKKKISRGEIKDVISNFPASLKVLWE